MLWVALSSLAPEPVRCCVRVQVNLKDFRVSPCGKRTTCRVYAHACWVTRSIQSSTIRFLAQGRCAGEVLRRLKDVPRIQVFPYVGCPTSRAYSVRDLRVSSSARNSLRNMGWTGPFVERVYVVIRTTRGNDSIDLWNLARRVGVPLRAEKLTRRASLIEHRVEQHSRASPERSDQRQINGKHA